MIIKRGSFMCYCGHWSDVHIPLPDGYYECQALVARTPEKYKCGCNDLREDVGYERAREAEARQLDYDSRREK